MVETRNALGFVMHRKFYCLLSSLFFAFNMQFSSAQNYIPLLNSPKEWHLTSCFSGCITDVYYINSDTIVEGLNYKVLDGFHYISRSFLFREEISNQKVFLSYPTGTKGNEEVLLYDFSLTVGDSFTMNNPITPFPPNNGVYILDSIIPKLLLDGLNHRFYYFSASSGNASNELPVWVEGVGSLSLINAPGGTPDVLGAGKLSCFFVDGALIYSQLDSIETCKPSSLSQAKAVEQKLELYPTIAKIFIEIKGIKNGQQASIYTYNGQKVITHEVTGMESEVLKIPVSQLSSGLYFLQVQSQKEPAATFRFIKE